MTDPLAPLREHLDAAYPAWSIRYAPAPTRGGLRYAGRDLAALLAPALTAYGLRTVGLDFVTASGRRVTRRRLAEVVREALAGHPDEALAVSVGVLPNLWDPVADRVPFFEGDLPEERPAPEPTPRAEGEEHPNAQHVRAHRARVRAAEEASARAFLDRVADRRPGERLDASEIYVAARQQIEKRKGYAIDPADDDSDYWTVPRRRVFYAVADAHPAFTRRRAARGITYVVAAIRRTVARLKEATMHALRYAAEVLGTGPADPETYADHVAARIGRPKAPPRAGVREVADALPGPVAAAVASAEDPRRALGLVGREWARRHPETRPAIVAAAQAFGDDLVEAIRWRVASEIEEER